MVGSHAAVRTQSPCNLRPDPQQERLPSDTDGEPGKIQTTVLGTRMPAGGRRRAPRFLPAPPSPCPLTATPLLSISVLIIPQHYKNGNLRMSFESVGTAVGRLTQYKFVPFSLLGSTPWYDGPQFL